MHETSLFQAIVLGILQGLTEFLPISSTAHLRVVPALLGWGDPGAAFTAVVQLGTLLAVLAFFWRELINLARALAVDLMARQPLRSLESRLVWMIGVGTIPICVFGLLFKDFIETGARSLWVIAASLIVLAILLALAEQFARHQRGMHQVGFLDGIVVGLAQAVALVPGSSRSGTTITAALFMGLSREAAARFSFLLSIPALLLSGLFELYQIRHDLGSENILPLAVATALAFVAGYLSIAFLLHYLRTHSTYLFVGYRIVVGVILITLMVAGVLQP